LRDLTGDQDELKRTLDAWRIGNDKLSLPEEVLSNHGGGRVLTHALELLDLYWPLPEKNK
jgi:hypothetical protein